MPDHCRQLKLNIGCGSSDFGSGWTNIDGGDYPHLDSKDILNLPYRDNSVDLMYASHVIGYFDRKEIIDVLKGWRSKLKPRGVLRLAIPDFKAMAKLYVNHDIPLSKFLGPLYGKMPMGEQIIYHRTTYDFSSLKVVLEEAMFREVREWNWREVEHGDVDDYSQAYLPHMDKDNGIPISLNVECTK